MGCAVFANAIDNLKGVDLAYNNFNSDFWLGQKKVFLNRNMLSDMAGGKKVTPDEVNQQLFYFIGETLDNGMKILEAALSGGTKVLDGETAFTLYDTYGFPLDLTADICRERAISVDEKGFDATTITDEDVENYGI